MADTVLLVLSAQDTRQAAEDVLRSHAYDVVSVEDGSAVIASFYAHRPVAVVLDADIPGANGLEVCRRLRAASDVPLVVVTPRTDEVDELLAFAVGADDCMAGTFSAKRLAARVDALVRRQAPDDRRVTDTLGYGPILMRRISRTVSVHGEDVPLTRTEFDLLCRLLEHPDHVISRAELIQSVWGEWHGDDHVIEVHLSRLRSKILAVDGPRIGDPVRGVGYRLSRRANR